MSAAANGAQRREVVVIGGGQAGLAAGYLLARQGREFTILEAAGEPAAAWRGRWDSLRLFTPVRRDSLPGRAFPGDPDSYPDRDQVVAYLEDYARHFELPVELDSRALAVRRAEDGFEIELADRRYLAGQVVIATGPFQVPFIPPIASGLAPEVTQLHSSDYRRPAQLPDGPVVVVGGGNTGYQIAEELVRSREVHLAIGARQAPLPQRILGRDLFDYLERLGLLGKTVDSRLAQRLKDKETLIGSSPRRARRQGIRLRKRVTGAQGDSLVFADGSRQRVGAVIWATGFRLDHTWVQLPVFGTDGRVEHRRGVTAVPGLYFLGLPWLHTRGSALLGWVKDDASHIAGHIAVHAGSPREQVAGGAAGGPPRMRAVVQAGYGDADVLSVAEIARPSIGDQEVLVEVRAAGMDRGTWHLMAGLPYPIRLVSGLRHPKNEVPGLDVAGVVEAVGAAVTRFRPGDEVFGVGQGSFAEYAAAREDKLAHKPPALSFELAAAIPVSGLTALKALTEVGRIEAGQRVLIIGASGGVGTFAVQIAKAMGARVTGVCSASKVDLVRSIGAEDVIDYTREDFADREHQFDLILDIGGNPSITRLRRALTARGTAVITGGEEGGRWTGGLDRQLRALALSPFVGQRLTTFVNEEHHAGLERLAELVGQGQVVPIVERTYPLSDTPLAMRHLMAGQARGKLVIAPQLDLFATPEGAAETEAPQPEGATP